MKTTELTDIDGDALTITQRLDATWITCTKGKKELTIGPVPTTALAAAVTDANDARTRGEKDEPDYDMDGGVTAALIEAGVVSPDRARSLVHERDEAIERAEKAEQELAEEGAWSAAKDAQTDRLVAEVEKAKREREQAESALATYVAAQASRSPRPLTPDAISADAYERGVPVLRAAPQKPSVMVAHETVREIVAAVLTEPPARPEGAEDVAVRLFQAGAAVGVEMTVEQRNALANHLAAMHVRVVGEEQP